MPETDLGPRGFTCWPSAHTFLSATFSIDMSGSQQQGAKGTPMTPEAAARVQGAEARAGSGGVAAGGFAARAQGAAEKNAGGQQAGQQQQGGQQQAGSAKK